ncbi:hypothetical protein Ancab_015267 [Ancistrocladus abbreviatus]
MDAEVMNANIRLVLGEHGPSASPSNVAEDFGTKSHSTSGEAVVETISYEPTSDGGVAESGLLLWHMRRPRNLLEIFEQEKTTYTSEPIILDAKGRAYWRSKGCDNSNPVL